MEQTKVWCKQITNNCKHLLTVPAAVWMAEGGERSHRGCEVCCEKAEEALQMGSKRLSQKLACDQQGSLGISRPAASCGWKRREAA